MTALQGRLPGGRRTATTQASTPVQHIAAVPYLDLSSALMTAPRSHAPPGRSLDCLSPDVGERLELRQQAQPWTMSTGSKPSECSFRPPFSLTFQKHPRHYVCPCRASDMDARPGSGHEAPEHSMTN